MQLSLGTFLKFSKSVTSLRIKLYSICEVQCLTYGKEIIYFNYYTVVFDILITVIIITIIYSLLRAVRLSFRPRIN